MNQSLEWEAPKLPRNSLFGNEYKYDVIIYCLPIINGWKEGLSTGISTAMNICIIMEFLCKMFKFFRMLHSCCDWVIMSSCGKRKEAELAYNNN